MIKPSEPPWDGNATVDCFEKPGLKILDILSPFLALVPNYGAFFLPLKTIGSQIYKEIPVN